MGDDRRPSCLVALGIVQARDEFAILDALAFMKRGLNFHSVHFIKKKDSPSQHLLLPLHAKDLCTIHPHGVTEATPFVASRWRRQLPSTPW